MTMRPPAPRGRAGFSMLEMLIALVVLSLVMGSAISVLRSQSRNFRRGGASMDLNQNARFAMSNMERTIRSLGVGTPNDQPMLVYADANTFVFNANFASNINDGSAVYINPDLPATAINSITTATPITLPGTAIAYPPRNYTWGAATPSRAETISFTFRADSSTADPNDFVLMERINNTPAEMVARNIRAYPGRPFFEYWYDSLTTAGTVFSKQVRAAQLPIYHSVAQHAGVADVGSSAFADSVKLVRVNLVVTNGLTDADSTSRRFSTMISIPNNGLLNLKTCGAAPLNAQAFNVVSPSSGAVELTWLPSADETTGEQDVSGYNLYYRLAADPTWTSWTTQAAGLAAYDVNAGGFTPDQDYVFGIAAQDCTPQESTFLTTANVHTLP
jgi:prepilin-type N-terminal cleavage/methylation domain-containing protein